MKNKEEILKIAVFKRLLTEEDGGYGVKLSIGNQSFKIDYYGDREEAQWMKDMLIRAINNLITQTREETIREVEQLIPERKDGGKNFDQWQYYCQGYNDLRDYILNKLKK